MELDQKRIGKRFRHVRKLAGLTQEKYGEVLGLSKNHISDIERGCSLPTVKVLYSVYVQFGHTPDEILLGTSPQSVDEIMKKLSALTPSGRRLLEKLLDNLLDEGL
ncbi:MAG: helix-turn-helix domain-containing protein [Eubacteriales bacterium]|nr:helix-turn-helix domain-containing protein [Eubacteriales bacterium]